MICPLCGNEVQSLTGPYNIFQPHVHGTDEGGTAQVCGQCYVLVGIHDKLIKLVELFEKWLTSTP